MGSRCYGSVSQTATVSVQTTWWQSLGRRLLDGCTGASSAQNTVTKKSSLNVLADLVIQRGNQGQSLDTAGVIFSHFHPLWKSTIPIFLKFVNVLVGAIRVVTVFLKCLVKICLEIKI